MNNFNDFPVGSKVRSYDFEPIPGRADSYVEGTITAHITDGTHSLVVTVETDSVFEKGVRDTVFAPLNVAFMEYAGRIVSV